MHHSRDIGKVFFVFHYKACRSRRRNLLTIINNTAAFLLDHHIKFPTNICQLCNNRLTFLRKSSHFPADIACSRLGHVVGNTVDRPLHIHVGVIQHGHAEALQSRTNFFLQNAQGFGCIACHQDAFTLGQKMSQQVCYRVSFPGTRRALHQDRIILLNTPSNVKLLFICLLRQ